MNFNANSEDKSIKTQAGNRPVPLHAKILGLGFLDYVDQISEKQQKLFPNLKKMKGAGFSTRISHWFTRYLNKLGIKEKGKNFHSFRHTVVNKLTNAKVYEPFIKKLIGYFHGSITLDVLLNECAQVI